MKQRVHGVWRGGAAVRDGRTVLTDSYHRAPLKVAKPFYAGDGTMGICLMDASPGLLGGDRQEIDCTLYPGARLFLTTQSSLRLHPGAGGEASESLQRFQVAPGAVLEYFPEPVVPFARSRHWGETVLEVAAGGTVLMAETVTPGRWGMGEVFQFRELALQTSVYRDGVLVAWDSLRLNPGRMDLESAWGGFTHTSILWIVSDRLSDEEVERLREAAEDREVYSGLSCLEGGGCVLRGLARSARALQWWLYRVSEIVRPMVGGASFPPWRKPGFF